MTKADNNAPNNTAMNVLIVMLVVTILAFAGNLYLIFQQNQNDAAYLQTVADMRVLAQRVDSSVRGALAGDEQAFDTLVQASKGFDQSLGLLRNGNDRLPAAGEMLTSELASLGSIWQKTRAAGEAIVLNRARVVLVKTVMDELELISPDLAVQLAAANDTMIASGLSAQRVAQVQRLALYRERVSRNVERILSGTARGTETAYQLEEDSEQFVSQLASLLATGAVNNPAARASLQNAQTLFQPIADKLSEVHASATELTAVNEAGEIVVGNAPLLSNAISQTSDKLNRSDAERPIGIMSAAGLGAVMLILLLLIAYQSSVNGRRRLAQEARTNERNQQAILRLLDELAGLADGDLTTTATVTEDFTGAIADAINFTVDQLRVLVSSINETSISVSTAADETQATALHLAEAAEHQAQEIAGASAAVNEMAITIDQVSSNAAESASVADRSVELAKTGTLVVQNTINGMDTIREQIQDTSKRIKRLGESSQEIGDIVSLINDIADQTNILALNAAIQASMAGDAGRGFAVVADEVQRLAERSGGATRQIEALVKTIQSDTHEAVSSMEQTTSEVVRGAKLAEDAGVALDEIDSVSRSLAELIQNISNAAQQQAASAGHISNTMNIIQEITSQTSAGTTATAQSIGKLSAITNELRNSVAGFKLP